MSRSCPEPVRDVLSRNQASFSRNRILSTLSKDDFESLRPHLERVPLKVRHMFEEPDEPIRHVYFPEPCVCSVVASTRDGERVEVGLFGPEGMSGLPLIHGDDRSPLQTFVQVEGTGIRIGADELRRAMEASPSMQRLMLRYAQAYSIQVAYTALANGRYTIDERLARWLLMCHDRIDGDVIHLTHEFLALMLGVRRAGVTTALQDLEGARVIDAGRGRIEILSRTELLEAAGDSYGPPEAEYERLMATG